MAAVATTTPRSTHRKRWITHAQQGAWTRAILMGIYVAITAFPFYWMFITAFKTNNDLYTLGAGASTEQTARIDTPCPGSSGAGEVMAMQVVFTAIEEVVP